MYIYIQRRYIGVFVAGLITFSSSLMTISIYGTLGAVVDLSVWAPTKASNPYCVKNASLTSNLNEPRLPTQDLYKWDKNTLESIDKSMFWSRMSFHVLGGVLADKYGSRWVVVAGISSSTFLCLFGPLIITQCRGYWQIILVYNIFRGFARGITYPAVVSFLGQWILDGEKTIVTGWVVTGNTLGEKINEIIAHVLREQSNWTTKFYIFGSVGVVVGVLWILFCYSSPELHKHINSKEKAHIRQRLGPYVDRKVIPWTKMLCSLPLWGLLLTYMGVGSCWAAVYGAIDEFITNGLGYHLKDGYKTTTVLIAGILNMGLGLVIDYLSKKDYIELATARKIVSNIGAMGAGLFCLTAAYVGCYESLVSRITLFAMCIAIFYKTAVYCNPLDLAPNFSGTIHGLGLTVYSCTRGALKMWIVVSTKDNRQQSWKMVLWICFAVCALSNMIFALSCSADEQDWNIPPRFRKQLQVKHEIEFNEEVDGHGNRATQTDIQLGHVHKNKHTRRVPL